MEEEADLCAQLLAVQFSNQATVGVVSFPYLAMKVVTLHKFTLQWIVMKLSNALKLSSVDDSINYQ